MARLDTSHPEFKQRPPRLAIRRWAFACRWLLFALIIASDVVGIAVRDAVADPNYIENLTFFDRSPGSLASEFRLGFHWRLCHTKLGQRRGPASQRQRRQRLVLHSIQLQPVRG